MMLLVLGIAYALTNLLSHCCVLAAGMQGEALRSVLEIDMECWKDIEQHAFCTQLHSYIFLGKCHEI